MLRYGYEWSSRKRIEHLFEDVPQSGVVEHGVDYFTGPVLHTRNYLTHYSADSEAEALHGAKLRGAVDELRRLLAFFLLKELGLDEERIVAAVADVPCYDYFSLD